MSYTKDHKYIIIITQSTIEPLNGIYVLNGFTADRLSSINYTAENFIPAKFTISQDSKYVAVGGNKGSIKIYQLLNGRLNLIKTYNSGSGIAITSLDFSQDG